MSLQSYSRRLIAAEINSLTRYCDVVVDRSGAVGASAALLPLVRGTVGAAPPHVPRRAFLLDGTFNHSTDIEGELRTLRAELTRHDRVVAVVYNAYFHWLYRLANAVGLRRGSLPTTFLTYAAVRGLARLAGFEVVRVRPIVHIPASLLGIGTALNKLLPAIPFIRQLSLASVITLRPVVADPTPPSLTLVVPARNERGNVAAALERLPAFPAPVEVIFVEGHSTDGTWDEIERVCRTYQGPARVRAIRQTGVGKADAVRAGFRVARHDLLAILDADLTMPPELLPRFYDAYRAGLGDFVNGNRLLYPMHGEAMRFLNRLGNTFFAKALSYVLDAPVNDSLCGTKLLARADWERCVRWREAFGEFDPFGDFELLFPAAQFGLGIVDLPIAYRERTYGTTNIHRFAHGRMLLRMVAVGFFRLKLGRTATA